MKSKMRQKYYWRQVTYTSICNILWDEHVIGLKTYASWNEHNIFQAEIVTDITISMWSMTTKTYVYNLVHTKWWITLISYAEIQKIETPNNFNSLLEQEYLTRRIHNSQIGLWLHMTEWDELI
jgi:hypothetical protein